MRSHNIKKYQVENLTKENILEIINPAPGTIEDHLYWLEEDILHFEIIRFKDATLEGVVTVWDRTEMGGYAILLRKPINKNWYAKEKTLISKTAIKLLNYAAIRYDIQGDQDEIKITGHDMHDSRNHSGNLFINANADYINTPSKISK